MYATKRNYVFLYSFSCVISSSLPLDTRPFFIAAGLAATETPKASAVYNMLRQYHCQSVSMTGMKMPNKLVRSLYALFGWQQVVVPIGVGLLITSQTYQYVRTSVSGSSVYPGFLITLINLAGPPHNAPAYAKLQTTLTCSYHFPIFFELMAGIYCFFPKEFCAGSRSRQN